MTQLLSNLWNLDGRAALVTGGAAGSVNKSPAMSGYAASKAALNHMGANLAHDYGPVVRINAVGPGATRTAALKKVLTPEIEKRMLAHTPIQRLGEPEDIAGAVLYFAALDTLPYRLFINPHSEGGKRLMQELPLLR